MIERATYKRLRSAALLFGVVALSVFMMAAWPKAKGKIDNYLKMSAIQKSLDFNGEPLKMLHSPSRFGTRTSDFTATFIGALSSEAEGARFRLNDDRWQVVRQEGPRAEPPFFMVELPADRLKVGQNTLTVEAVVKHRHVQARVLRFDYVPETVALPLCVDWDVAGLDVQDGHWEKIHRGSVTYSRPVPGHEGYDRILAVTSAFEGGRRVEVDLIFRHAMNQKERFGFGVLPLWGGRPDDPDRIPRRGWNFSIAWYYSHYDGVGMEFSYKQGAKPPDWLSTYLNYAIRPDTRYRIVTETRTEVDKTGRHLRYRQRMKWWAEDEPEPGSWMDLSDSEGCALKPGPYAVALVAHRSQVEFGPVRVERLDPVRADSALNVAEQCFQGHLPDERKDMN